MAINLDTVNGTLKSRIATAQKIVEDHRTKMAENPFEALGWISNVVAAAAELKVFTAAMRVLNNGHTTPEKYLTFVKDTVVAQATYSAPRSSGFLDGQLQTEELRAWSTVLSFLQGDL